MLNPFKKKKRIVVDTNFLMLPGELGIDIFTEITRIMQEPYELYVVEQTIQELEKIVIKDGKKKEGFNAKLGFILLKQKSLKTIKNSNARTADEAILDLASDEPEDLIVATQDKLLREKLKKFNIQTIVVKQGKYLSLG